MFKPRYPRVEPALQNSLCRIPHAAVPHVALSGGLVWQARECQVGGGGTVGAGEEGNFGFGNSEVKRGVAAGIGDLTGKAPEGG